MRETTRSRPTLIAGTAPPPALRPPPQGVPALVEDLGTPAPIERDVHIDIDADEPTAEFRPEKIPGPPERHSPPHTPPVISPPTRPEIDEAPVLPRPETLETPSKPTELEPKPKAQPEEIKPVPKPSVVGTIFKILVLLILLSAAGVMVWSLVETGNPNPLPLLQDKLGL